MKKLEIEKTNASLTVSVLKVEYLVVFYYVKYSVKNSTVVVNIYFFFRLKQKMLM